MAERQQERAELVGMLRCTAGVHPHLNTDAQAMLYKAARLLEEDGKEIERIQSAYETSYRLGGEWRDRAEKAEARVSELEQALEDLGEAHRLLAAQGLMAACADEGKDQ
jgi:hypothetical protein